MHTLTQTHTHPVYKLHIKYSHKGATVKLRNGFLSTLYNQLVSSFNFYFGYQATENYYSYVKSYLLNGTLVTHFLLAQLYLNIITYLINSSRAAEWEIKYVYTGKH